MIGGVVNARYEAVIPLELQGPTGQTRQVEVVLDTGYNGRLVLPPSLVADLRLPSVSVRRAFLANGDEVTFSVHEVTAAWDGRPRRVNAGATGTTPLVGMRMLEGYTLSVEVKEGGRVVIQAEA